MRKVGFEVWFGFWFVVVAVRYLLPEIRDEVPKNFQRTAVFDRQRVLIGRMIWNGRSLSGNLRTLYGARRTGDRTAFLPIRRSLWDCRSSSEFPGCLPPLSH